MQFHMDRIGAKSPLKYLFWIIATLIIVVIFALLTAILFPIWVMAASAEIWQSTFGRPVPTISRGLRFVVRVNNQIPAWLLWLFAGWALFFNAVCLLAIAASRRLTGQPAPRSTAGRDDAP